MMTLNIYFKCTTLTKGKLALVVWWVEPQTFCLGFKSLQQHKKKAFLRVPCSALTGWNIGDFIPFWSFFSDVDILAIYWRFFVDFQLFFSTKYRVDVFRYTIYHRYIPTFSSLMESKLMFKKILCQNKKEQNCQQQKQNIIP